MQDGGGFTRRGMPGRVVPAPIAEHALIVDDETVRDAGGIVIVLGDLNGRYATYKASGRAVANVNH